MKQHFKQLHGLSPPSKDQSKDNTPISTASTKVDVCFALVQTEVRERKQDGFPDSQ